MGSLCAMKKLRDPGCIGGKGSVQVTPGSLLILQSMLPEIRLRFNIYLQIS